MTLDPTQIMDFGNETWMQARMEFEDEAMQALLDGLAAWEYA